MVKLKREMGSDAVILHTRKIKQPGFIGLFKKSLIEIVAAKEENLADNNTHNKNNIKYQTMEFNDIAHHKNQVFTENENTYELRKHLKTLQGTMDKVIKSINQDNYNMLPENMNFYRKFLISNGVDDFVATKIMERINRQADVSTKENERIDPERQKSPF